MPAAVDKTAMSLFQWDEKLLVGHSDIDTQHKRLFQLADDLHQAMAAGKATAKLSEILGSLIAYTKMHFASEERLMQKYNYPDYAAHKALHEKLTAQVMDFQKDFSAGRAVLTIDLMQFLKNWLFQHIGKTDQKVAEFLRKKAA
jgi:hemerythrin